MTRAPRRPAHRVVLAAVALVATAALVGCGTETPTETPTQTLPGSGGGPRGGHAVAERLDDSRWTPEEVTVGGERLKRPARLTDAYVVLRPDGDSAGRGGSSGGVVGCNRIGAQVTIRNDALRVADLVTTKVGCPGPEAAFENGFLDVFDGRLTIEIDDEDGPGDPPDNQPATLTLTNEAGDTIELTGSTESTESTGSTGSTESAEETDARDRPTGRG